MFKFENVCKTYKSKRGTDCDALRDLNLTLPDCGMVILVGRSGSGKSTLLNILGGLDKPTSGEISFNGNKFSTFKDSDFSNYRNNTLGFVFQEFNLIENIDVGQNVALPLSLQNRKDKTELVSSALEKVGLKGYEKRKINELSGGQKQRVAIARAIVKSPQVILADEPTGNLDEKTSEEIFELLKELSKECLVVTVTHDKENGRIYHDYLIELVDGRVVFNNCTDIKEKQEPIKKHKTSLPFSLSVKMGADNLLKRKVRSVSVILVSIVTIFCILIAQFLLLYSREKTLARIVQEKGLKHFYLNQDYRNDFSSANGYLRTSTLKQLENYTDLAYSNLFNSYQVIKSSQDILDLGFSFDGNYLELNDNSVYISEQTLETLYNSQSAEYKKEDGTYEKLLKSEVPKSEIVGKEIKISFIRTYIIAGIFNVNALTANNKYEQAFKQNIHDTFCLESYVNLFKSTKTVDFNHIFHSVEVNLKTSNYESNINNTFSIYNGGTNDRYRKVVLSDGTIESSENLKLEPSEIVLSLSAYNKLFDSDLTQHDYVKQELSEETWEHSYALRKLPKNLGTQLQFEIFETGYPQYGQNQSLTLAGVSLDFQEQEISIPDYITLSNSLFYDIANVFCVDSVLVKIGANTDVLKLLNDMKNAEVDVIDPYTRILNEVDEQLPMLQYIFIFMSVSLSIIIVILVINLISISIISRAKELGILKALGAKTKDIFSIFFSESLIMSIIIFCISFGLSFATAALLNYAFLMDENGLITLFFVNIVTVLILFFASFVLIFFATLIPLMKIKKMNPVDAIKAVN